MIICFTGHRDCMVNELKLAGIQMDYQPELPEEFIWWHGGAKSGFDRQVQDHIESNSHVITSYRVFYPDYQKYPPKVAPIMRNHEMIDAKPDLLVALWDGRITGGTYDTINYAKSKGIEVKYLEVAKYIKLAKGKVL